MKLTSPLGIAAILSGGRTYEQKIKSLFGSYIIANYPVIYDGKDNSGNNKNGSISGTIATADGIGDGLQSALFDGTQFINLDPALTGSPMPSEGSILIWSRIPTAATWDGTAAQRRSIRIFSSVSGDNVIFYQGTPNTAKLFSISSYIGAVSRGATIGTSRTSWMFTVMTWSQSANFINTYLDAQLLSSQTYTNAFTPTAFSLGLNWIGMLAHCTYLSKAATLDDLKTLIQPRQSIGVLGDSIAASPLYSWPKIVSDSYPSGYTSVLHNHAVGSMGILVGVSNMAAQVASSSLDDATKIIIALGTNDNPAGDMAVLRAAVESGIDTLRSTNPRATIYYLNILPEWTDAGGGTEIDNHIIREAIATACANKNVTCWDPYAENWIVASDTSDGTHLTAGGHAKVAAQELARL